jgi:CheY-like chemotaxis protein
MDLNKKIFLLIDDDKDDRELFVEAVESFDSQITGYMAVDGQQALDLLESLSDGLPDIIFLDINMPVMNGWHCLKALKHDERYRHIPVIMYSTSSHQREVDIAIDLGALCFCVKPEKFSTMKHILEIVHHHLGGKLIEELKKNSEGSFRFKKTESDASV